MLSGFNQRTFGVHGDVMVRWFLSCGLFLSLAPGVSAQHVHPAPAPATIAAATSSLSAEDVQQLLDGEGMGLAKAAELNGYPGPKHVLERAAHLDLTDDQRAKIEEIRERMLGEARRLGKEIVDAERALDEAFRSRSVDGGSLTARTAAIGALQARLRATHLAAHLESVTVLTPAQVKHYYEMGAHGSHGK
jgi:Spy/CpxP family protein refolding chaperone